MLCGLSLGTIAQSSITLPQTITPDQVEEKKKTKNNKYVDSRHAKQIKEFYQDSVLFLDIRTKAEIAYVGSTSMVDGFVSYMEHEPFMPWSDTQKRFAMEPNADFVKGVAHFLEKKGLSKDAPIILLCRSGDRSAKAADLLLASGYPNAYSVVDGFEGDLSPEGMRTVNGWKNKSLKWSYKVDKDKLYNPWAVYRKEARKKWKCRRHLCYDSASVKMSVKG